MPFIDANWGLLRCSSVCRLAPYDVFPSGGFRKADFYFKLDEIGWKIGGPYEIVNWMELEV